MALKMVTKRRIKIMIIDLRSDTVTRPCEEMLNCMMNAPLGDDVYGEDPSVNSLQKYCADLFDKEAALFCPSGTMSNQLALLSLTKPLDAVLIEERSHINIYECGGAAFHSGVSLKTHYGDEGKLNLQHLENSLNPLDDIHMSPVSTVCLENTTNKAGGFAYAFDEIVEIKSFCDDHNLSLHCDGARLMNACISKNYTTREIGPLFTSISLCLSKGLGAPVGSVLISSREVIAKALRFRKLLGGGMRQAGILASAGLFALKKNRDKLIKDHERADYLAQTLNESGLLREQALPETNIIYAKLDNEISSTEFVHRMEKEGILCLSLGSGEVRFVTHLDFDDEQLDRVIRAIKNL